MFSKSCRCSPLSSRNSWRTKKAVRNDSQPRFSRKARILVGCALIALVFAPLASIAILQFQMSHSESWEPAQVTSIGRCLPFGGSHAQNVSVKPNGPGDALYSTMMRGCDLFQVGQATSLHVEPRGIEIRPLEFEPLLRYMMVKPEFISSSVVFLIVAIYGGFVLWRALRQPRKV